MKITTLMAAAAMLAMPLAGLAQRAQTPVLDRGLVAVKTSFGVFCSWRITGEEYYDVAYNVYRDGTLLTPKPITVSNFTDAGGSASSQYTVQAVVRGAEQAQSPAASVWQSNYLEIVPDHGTLTSEFEPNDATIADLDGDGRMELLVKFRNVTDAAASYPTDGTEFDIIECYTLDGTKLWWIDCGPNMTDFQSNEINIAAYDWDGDGRAECILRGADAMVIHMADGTTHTVGDPSVNTRDDLVRTSAMTFTHTGAEYLLYLDGLTGKVYQELTYPLARLEAGETDLSAAWGDGYGHRSSKHFFGAPYLDGRKPSIFLARGIYTRHKMIAYDVDPSTHTLTKRWAWNCNTPGSPWYGQGYHNYSIADVDLDGRDEIVFGSMVIDDNGRGLSTTGLGHGDAHHVSDFNPYVHGLEIYACNEDQPANNYRDGTTSRIYYRFIGTADDGRSMCGNFCNDYLGAMGLSAHDSPISCVTNDHLDGLVSTGVTQNFRIYWDGDLQEESFNGAGVSESAGCIYKYGSSAPIATFTGTLTNNSTKATPCLQADIFGDWREEVVMRTSAGNIRIYTTTATTTWRNYTLLDDHQYRNAMITQMNGYNQPPHVSYFLGELEQITVAPPPVICTGRTEIEAGTEISSAHNGKHIFFAPTADATFSVASGAEPYILTVNTPSHVQGNDDNDNITRTYFTHTATGAGFGGEMRLIKQGDGTLVLPAVDQTYTGNTEVWAGTLSFDGRMTASPVHLNRFARLDTKGSFARRVSLDYGAVLSAGGPNAAGTATVDTLELNFGARVEVDLYSEDTKADVLKIKQLTINTFDPATGVLPYDRPVIGLCLHPAAGETRIASGRYLIAEVGSLVGSVDNLAIDGKDGNKVTLVLEEGKLYVDIEALRDPTTIYWVGDKSADWDLYTTFNFVDAEGNETGFVTGDAVVFDQRAQAKTVNVTEVLRPASVTVAATAPDLTIGGDSLCISGALTKQGASTLTVTGFNTMTGGTVIAEGVVVVPQLGYKEGNQTGALGTLTDVIELAGGTLSVSGAVYSSQTIKLSDASAIDVPAGSSLLLTAVITPTSSTSPLTKTGAGALTFGAGKNGGELHIVAGTVYGSENTAFGKIVFEGGSMVDKDDIYSYSSIATSFEVAAGQKGALYLDSRCNYTGSLTGSGTLSLEAHSIRTYINGDWSAFEGTINLTGKKTGSYDPMLYFNNNYGIASATLNNAGVFDNNARDVTIGQVLGSGTLQGSGTYSIGSLGTDFTLKNTLSGCGLAKVGSGVMTMTTVQTGLGKNVEVIDGVLNLRQSSINSDFFGKRAVNVSGGALSGRAQVVTVSVLAGGTIRPGDATKTSMYGYMKVGTLTVAEGGTAEFHIETAANTVSARSYLTVTSTLTINGTISVNMADTYVPADGDAIILWMAGEIALGSGIKYDLPDLPAGLEWDTSAMNSTTGTLKVRAVSDGIDDIGMNEQVRCVVYDLTGQRVAEFTTERAGVETAIRNATSRRGVFVVRMTALGGAVASVKMRIL